MKQKLLFIGLLALLLTTVRAWSQITLTPGNILVNRLGDGSTTLSGAATSINILEYSPAGTLIQTISDFSGANLLTESGSATSNGYIGYRNGALAVPGYNAALGTLSVAATNTKASHLFEGDTGELETRVLFPTGGPSGTPPSPYSGNNFRSIFPTGLNTFYTGGTSTGTPTTGGVWYYNGTEFIKISNSSAQNNIRNVAIYNDQLYFSTGSGTVGIYSLGIGTPTTANHEQTAFITETNMSPYAFFLIDTDDDGTIDRAFIADDRATNANGGINRWDLNTETSTWTRTYARRFNTSTNQLSAAISGVVSIRGLSGWYNEATGVTYLYATTTETNNNYLIAFSDDGTATPATSFTTLAQAGNAFYVFRGVSFIDNVIFNENVSLTDFNINQGGSATILSGNGLTVSGTLTNNAGSTGLIIESDASGTGSLIHNTNNVPATVQRYITGSTNLLSRYYHHVSIPLNSNVLSNQFNGSYLFSFNQGTQTWDQITQDNVTLNNNQGYMIFYPNTSTTYNFAGQLNNGAFVASTTTDAIDEYSLVPNPYPSAIDWDAASGWTKTNLQDAIWIWNPVSQNYASYITGAGTNGGSRYIATGQAFFVKSSAASPVLSMDNNVRLHNAQAFFNTPINNQMLRVRAEANGFSDEAIVRFHADASLNFEMNLDVDKLRGNEVAPQLYTLSADARELSINSVPFAVENFTMPLNFECASEGEITFIFSELNTFEEGVSMFLEDKTTGEMINILEQQSYSFSHTAGNDPDRFNLHFFGVTGVEDVAVKGSYQIWSNDRKVFVNIPELNGQRAHIEMFDVLGSRIFSSEAVMNSPAVVRAANSGVAIVRVTAQGRVYTTKLFIQ